MVFCLTKGGLLGQVQLQSIQYIPVALSLGIKTFAFCSFVGDVKPMRHGVHETSVKAKPDAQNIMTSEEYPMHAGSFSSHLQTTDVNLFSDRQKRTHEIPTEWVSKSARIEPMLDEDVPPGAPIHADHKLDVYDLPGRTDVSHQRFSTVDIKTDPMDTSLTTMDERTVEKVSCKNIEDELLPSLHASVALEQAASPIKTVEQFIENMTLENPSKEYDWEVVACKSDAQEKTIAVEELPTLESAAPQTVSGKELGTDLEIGSMVELVGGRRQYGVIRWME